MLNKTAHPIRFKFHTDKLAACIALLAQENLPELTKLKVVKLLYYIDKYHLTRYGRPVTGDVYYHWDHGPVPIQSLNVINEVLDDDDVSKENGETDKDVLSKYIRVNRFSIPAIKRRRYPIFELNSPPNVDCLAASEIEAIKEVVKKYGQFSPIQLRDETHKDPTWSATQRNEQIDYSLFFEGDPDARREALEYLESLREDSEFISELTSSD